MLLAGSLAAAAACADDANDADDLGPTTTVDSPVAPTTTTPDVAPTTDPDTDTTDTTDDTTDDTVESQPPPGTDDGELRRGSGGSWTPEHVATMELTDDNTAPVIDEALAEERIDPDYWMWDWWPIGLPDGEPAQFGRWHVAIALAAPSDLLPGQRHDVAQLRYYLSDDDGETWSPGGNLIEYAEAEGARQWAGSTLYDPETETVYVFYTAAGETGRRHEPAPGGDSEGSVSGSAIDAAGNPVDASRGTGAAPASGDYVDGEGDISYEQRMVVTSATIEATDDGVTFGEWSDHTIILEGDGEMYAMTAATEGGAGEIDAFRDPEYFRDPADGREYLTFTATMPSAECDGDGVIGIAVLSDPTGDDATAGDDGDDTAIGADRFTQWEMLPPLIDAHCVNNELERPHIVVQDGMYYLFFTTHAHTFDAESLGEDQLGPEGLYGFVAESVTGPYEPLNGSGLVLANPADAPYQAYSWLVLPNGVATSFFQFWGLDDDVDLDYIGDQDPEFQMERFGGTFAPSVALELDGTTTRVVDELSPGALFVGGR